MMSSSTQTSNHASGGDRITNLHESVVSNILSRLLTKDAVGTSIFSKDWKHKWISSYSVDINYRCLDWRTERTFINSMNRILLSSEHLRSFRFTCWNFWDSSCLQTWIDVVLRRHNLECFEINFYATNIVFPHSLLNSTSLRELKLVQRVTSHVNVAAKNCVPNLTSLHLDGVGILNANPNSSTVTFNFPVLKTFKLIATKWLNLKSVEIYAPSLTTFSSKPQNYNQDYDYTIKIVSPKLHKFSCSHGIPENFILDGSSSVYVYLLSEGVTQDFQLLKTIGFRARNILNVFTGLEELKLSGFMAEVSQLGPPLHRHDKLTRLTLCDPSNAEQLFELLHAMPSLEFLCLDMDDWEDYDYEAMVTPPCIVSNLEEVMLLGFYGTVPQYNLAKFLLKTAERMKSVFVRCHQLQKPPEITKVLSTYPRCSLSLTINVHW